MEADKASTNGLASGPCEGRAWQNPVARICWLMRARSRATHRIATDVTVMGAGLTSYNNVVNSCAKRGVKGQGLSDLAFLSVSSFPYFFTLAR